MKAIRVTQFGGPEVLALAEVPLPEPGPGQVRVKVEAAGVNPVETYIRSGTYARLPSLPYTPGTDGAGVVDALGEGVESIAIGERVYVTTILGRASTGTYAEYLCCDVECVHPLPATVTAGQGAAIGVPYATAWRALFQKAHLVPGDTVFVHGASGGVGLAAVQIARAHGARVIGTAGTAEGLELIRSEGAHVALNHATSQYLDELARVTGGNGPDVILEMLANVNLDHDLTMIAPKGRIVVIGNRGRIEIDPRKIMGKQSTVTGFALWGLSADDVARGHEAIGVALASGALRPVVGTELPLAEAAEAQRRVMAPGARGKIVLVM